MTAGDAYRQTGALTRRSLGRFRFLSRAPGRYAGGLRRYLAELADRARARVWQAHTLIAQNSFPSGKASPHLSGQRDVDDGGLEDDDEQRAAATATVVTVCVAR